MNWRQIGPRWLAADAPEMTPLIVAGVMVAVGWIAVAVAVKP